MTVNYFSNAWKYEIKDYKYSVATIFRNNFQKQFGAIMT